VVLFPIIPYFDHIQPLLTHYRKIVDVVDNQYSWPSADQQAIQNYSRQYATLTAQATRVCFNSRINLDHFTQLGMLDDRGRIELIPNWYELPAGASGALDSSPVATPRIVYSGNMNDRMDWDLLLATLELPAEPELHLIGSAARAPEEQLLRVLDHERVVYHGPLPEKDSLAILAGASAAIMPHTVDQHSTFMNPLKISMFRALGLPVVTSDVPGIEPDQMCHVAHSRADFLVEVEKQISGTSARSARAWGESGSPHAAQYVALIDEIL
jgi:glycosyltransferase involved in cell wall biosynthesis